MGRRSHAQNHIHPQTASLEFEGGHAKNMASKGGPAKKIWCVKGGSPKKLPLSLVVTASVIMQTSVPEGQK